MEYNQPDLLERLRSYGYKITQETRIFEVDGDSFNPMEFTRYEHDIGDLFMFHGLAVNVDRWNGIKTLCKRNLSLNDATREWNLEDAVEVASYSIPNDKLGELALKINDLRFDVWSEHYQAPGESEDLEERLDDLSYLSDRMKKGISPVDDLEELKEDRSLAACNTDEVAELAKRICDATVGYYHCVEAWFIVKDLLTAAQAHLHDSMEHRHQEV